MAFVHNRAAESHEILSECSHQLCKCKFGAMYVRSLFTFGIGSLLLHRFDAPFK